MWIEASEKLPPPGQKVLWYGKRPIARGPRKGQSCDMLQVASFPTHFNFTPTHWFAFPSPPTSGECGTGENIRPSAEIADYDCGMLNDYGGGNVDWWWDYIRAETNRCNEYWRSATSHVD